MRLLSPKNVMMCLIILFLLVNIFFFLDYYFLNLNKRYSRSKDKKNNQVEILKEYVDFNSTTFENKAGIHFYYGAIKRTNLINNLTTFKENNFFKEDKLNIFVDRQGRVCEEINLIDNTCKVEIDFDLTCNRQTMCCLHEFMCVSQCIKNTLDLSQCKKRCSLTYVTKDTELPFCFRSDLNNLNYSLLYSNKGQSCEELCLSHNLTCHNNILALINQCNQLKEKFNCVECTMVKNIFGPAMINTGGNLKNPSNEYKCAYTDNNKISCKFKQKNISRICICISI